MNDQKIPDRRLKWAAFAALLFAAGIVLQVLLILIRGEPFCLNTGCRVVEELVEVNPMLFNMLGASFFLACAVSAAAAGKHPVFPGIFIFLCTAGMAAEGILLGYQTFVAGEFCSYCLTVLAAIIILNLIAGIRQTAVGAGILLIEMILFSLLNFNISTANIQQLTLDNGTYAITRCQAPSKSMYLIFSQDCPHCNKVLEALAGCSQCEFHFNPVKEIDEHLLPGTIIQEDYVPEINRLALRILGIDSIPVLIVKRRDGFLLIKGDQEIIDFIQRNCFSTVEAPDSHDVPYTDSLFDSRTPLLPDDSGGACSMEQECEGN
jgi:hypothetical protein